MNTAAHHIYRRSVNEFVVTICTCGELFAGHTVLQADDKWAHHKLKL